jgi:mannose-6-phosphate isomerase
MAAAASSPSSHWAPFRIAPAFVARVWGYDDLHPWFDFTATSGPVGEVWLSGDQCLAETGIQAGQSLGDLFRDSPRELLGSAAPDEHSPSPLLIKVLFAREKLSVQVHPDDALAQKYGQPRGKTECWYALAAEPGAQVAVGLKPGVTLEKVREAIQNKTLENDLNLLPVSTGDMVYVDAGTVHAIWPGSILLEVQQNSDITYRLYDYGRPRELHIEKGLEAARLKTRAGIVPPRTRGRRTVLIDASYFRIERVPVDGRIPSGELAGEDGVKSPGLSYLFAASGAGRISGTGFEPFEVPARSIVCVPASSFAFTLEDRGALDLIRIVASQPALESGQ